MILPPPTSPPPTHTHKNNTVRTMRCVSPHSRVPPNIERARNSLRTRLMCACNMRWPTVCGSLQDEDHSRVHDFWLLDLFQPDWVGLFVRETRQYQPKWWHGKKKYQICTKISVPWSFIQNSSVRTLHELNKCLSEWWISKKGGKISQTNTT